MSRRRNEGAFPLGAWRVWWLNPSVALGFPAAVAAVTAYATDASNYTIFWRTPKYFDLRALGLVFAVIFIFSAGCTLGGAQRLGTRRSASTDWTQRIRWQPVRILFKVSFALTVLAYAVWFAVAVKNGLSLSVVSDVLRGANGATYDLRDEYLGTIPGVTTATEFGLAVIALGVPLGVATGWRGVRWPCLTVFGLAVIRAFLNSERLAAMELLVPFIVSFIWLRPPSQPRARKLTQAVPFFGPVLLYFVFGAAEYFRSWSSFYAARESNFWSFIGLRLMGYYTTALNNGALLWKVSRPLSYKLSPATLDFLWRFPVIGDLIPSVFPFFHLSAKTSDARYSALLATSANPELTNPSGIFGPIVDFGVRGGILYWFLCGLVCGYLYREFKSRNAAGLFLYPLVFISFSEASRILYWAEGRFFPAMFLLVVCVLFVFHYRYFPIPQGISNENAGLRTARAS